MAASASDDDSTSDKEDQSRLSILTRGESAFMLDGRPSSPSTSSAAGTSAAPATPKAGKHREDFEFGDVLGEGSFGQVLKCVELETNKQYAVKIMSKSHVKKENKIKYVTTERDLLDKCRHVSIIRLHYCFTDAQNLYYVIEVAPKGEILHWLRELGSFSLEVARFYTAELVVALEFLASMRVIHRDLKPENILMSSKFHIKLTDFGTAKNLVTIDTDGNELTHETSKSFLGTAEYVSPELLVEKYTCLASDLWSLGCIVFQFLTGKLPFHAPTDYLIFQRIQKRDIVFPPSLDLTAKDLIEKLLVLNPSQRLGASAADGSSGFPALKAHPFFEGIVWEGLFESAAPDLESLANEKRRTDEAAAAAAAAALAASSPSTSSSAGGSTVDSKGAGPSSPPAKRFSMMPVQTEAERANRLELQKASQWYPFVDPTELILKDGLVDKRKGLSTKRRGLVLTDKPRLVYIDPKKMEKKGEIQWSDELYGALGKGNKFFVHTVDRVFNFSDGSGPDGASEWVEAINTLQAEVRVLKSTKR